jgi:hypothetical protein
LPELKQGSVLQRLLVEAVSAHNVLPLTGRCNLSCVFCSHRHNPPGTKAYSFGPLAEDILSSLIPYLDPGKKIIIGESATRLREGEPLTYPWFLPLLRKIRKLYPDTVIQVTTNGTLLDRPLINAIAALQPLEMVLSVNSISAAGRSSLMGDAAAVKICAVIEMLQELQIGFHGSLVAMPHLVGFEDLRQTLTYLEQSGARSIRLLLPGFTRLFNPALVPTEEITGVIYRMVAEMQKHLCVPLLAEPPLINNLEPVVAGVSVNSAAEQAGLKSGDLIIDINGKKPFSRVDAYNILNDSENPSLIIGRGSQQITTVLRKAVKVSPGIAVAYDLQPAQVEKVKMSIDPQGENLMLVSNPALQRWQRALQFHELENIELLPVRAGWFGGTINCAGLLTIGDFQGALDNLVDLNQYQRILIPGIAFDRSGNDLQGCHYLSLNSFGIPVRVV